MQNPPNSETWPILQLAPPARTGRPLIQSNLLTSHEAVQFFMLFYSLNNNLHLYKP